MKRFVGYISLCISFLVAIFVGVAPTILGINGNGDYSYSRNYVFKISQKQVNGDFSDGTEQDFYKPSDNEKQPIDIVTDDIKSRLTNANVSEYRLETYGDNMFELTFKDYSDNYDEIVKYLTFSNSLMATTYNETSTLGFSANQLYSGSKLEDNEFFVPGSAYVEYKEGYPYVVLELSNPEEFKKMVTTIQDNFKDEGEEQQESQNPYSVPVAKEGEPLPPEGGEGEPEAPELLNPEKCIYVLNNWLTGFKLKDILSNENKNINNENLSKYVLTYFNATEPESFFWNYDFDASEEEQKKITYDHVYFKFYNLGEANTGEAGLDVTTANKIYNSYEPNDSLAYKKANLFANRFNASTYNYEITIINKSQVIDGTNFVPPFVEYIKRAGIIELSTILAATIIGFVIASLFMVLNYGVSAIMGIVVTTGNVLTTLGIFNILGNEFNLGTILGLLTVALVSIFTSCMWLSKAKNEIYAGKNLKKAYQEANRKSNFMLLDFSIISVIIGLTCYLVQNSITISFGAALLLGTVANVLTNGILFRGVLWFLYNSNYSQNHLRLLQIDTKIAADLSKDQESVYLKSFNKRSSKTNFRVVGSVFLALVVASICGITSFQLVNGNIYNSETNQTNTRLVIDYNQKNVTDKFDTDGAELNIKKSLGMIYTDEAKENKLFSEKALNKLDIDSFFYEYNYGENNSVKNKEVYFIVDLGSIYDLTEANTTTYYYEGASGVTRNGNLETVIKTAIDNEMSSKYVSTIVNSYNIKDDSNNTFAAIATAIAVGFITFYFLLRFGLSKALTSLLLGAGILTSIVGIFSLVRGPFPSEVTLGLFFVMAFAYLVLATFFNNERLTYVENKRVLSDLSKREEAYDFTNNLTYSSVLVAGGISALLVMSFIFSKSFSQYTLLFILLGMLLTCIFVKALTLETEMFFTKGFTRIKGKVNKPRKNNKKQKAKSEDGPEEAIFIGIND